MSKLSTLSGEQIVGLLSKALRLNELLPGHGDAWAKRRQRHFNQGQRVKRPCELVAEQVCVVTGAPACACRRVPRFTPALFAAPRSAGEGRLFTLDVHTHARSWNRVVARHRDDLPTITRAFMRFAALELAYKASYLRVREGQVTSAEHPASWADQNGVARPIRELIDELARVKGCSMERLDAGVSIETLKSWRGGERQPTHANLAKLTKLVPDASERSRVHASIVRHYALARITAGIRSAWGDAFADDLARVYASAVACGARRRERPQPLPDHVAQVLDVYVLAFSSWVVPSDTYVSMSEHHAPEWRSDIELATRVWSGELGDDFIQRAERLGAWLGELHG